MITTKIAGAAAALALLAAPATAAAHDGHHHGRHHHHHHRANVREVTGTATATVASFANGDLTLSLPSGRTFTAAVTDHTEIACIAATPRAAAARHGGGDDNDNDGPNHDAGDDNGNDGPNHDAGDDHGNDGADHDAGDDHGDDNAKCGSAALVAGAKVAAARLSVLGGDATWQQVVIVK